MNCRQAVGLMDKYLDNRLEYTYQIEFDKHLSNCEMCSAELLKRREIYSIFGCCRIQDCPDSVQDNIMNRIIEMKQREKSAIEYSTQESYGVFFRRLGVSMVLAAVIMITGFFIPSGKYNIFNIPVYAKTNTIFDKHVQVSEAIHGIDDVIKDFIKGIGNSFKNIKGWS